MKKSVKGLSLMLAGSLMIAVLGGCTSAGAQTIAKKTRLETIKEKGVLEVVMEPYFAPNQFIDPTKTGNDQYVGSDVELSKYIAEKLGVKVKIVPLEFGAVLSSITEGKYDLAISGLAYTPARAEAMTMSKGYYFSKDTPGYGLLVRTADLETIKSADDLSDKTVVVQSGSLQELFANEQIPQMKELKRVSATTDGILMVQENKADAIVVAKSMGQLYIDANPTAGLSIVDGFEFKVDEQYDGMRIGITKGETDLETKINEIIDEVVKSGIYDKWYNEYTEYAKKLGL
ncbi:MAG: transporter substrate-binding domain-containing protein [Clostridiaceae bacterium]